MTQFTNPLSNVKIASPCNSDWDAMVGNNRQRYCGECKLNVYNLSGMTKYEAENLLVQSEGNVCVRFYRRPDGTVLTKDCPVGWKAVRARMSKFWTASVSLLFAVFGGIGFTTYLTQSENSNDLVGKPAISHRATTGTLLVNNDVTMGTPEPLMGNVSADYSEVEGKVSNLNAIKGEIIRKYSN